MLIPDLIQHSNPKVIFTNHSMILLQFLQLALPSGGCESDPLSITYNYLSLIIINYSELLITKNWVRPVLVCVCKQGNEREIIMFFCGGCICSSLCSIRPIWSHFIGAPAHAHLHLHVCVLTPAQRLSFANSEHRLASKNSSCNFYQAPTAKTFFPSNQRACLWQR